MKDLLNSYFKENIERKVLPLNRAFIGLYSILSCLSKKSNRKKVLYPPTTCASPVYATTFAGLKPVFADVSLSDYLIDEKATIRYIELYKDELLAVVYIYIFGHTSDSVLRIKEVCDKYGIYLIEDVAQAFGSNVDGIPTGLIGHYSVFSFGYSKQVEVGIGGLFVNNMPTVVSNKEMQDFISNIEFTQLTPEQSQQYKKDFYDFRLESIVDESKYIKYLDFPERFHDLYFTAKQPDWNKISDKLRSFLDEDMLTKRNQNAKKYYEGFSCESLKEYVYAPELKDGYSIYRYTILLTSEENSLKFSDYLRNNGINCSNLYIPVNRFYGETDCPNALLYAKKCVNLWVDAGIATDEYIEKTIELTKQYFAHNE